NVAEFQWLIAKKENLRIDEAAESSRKMQSVSGSQEVKECAAHRRSNIEAVGGKVAPCNPLRGQKAEPQKERYCEPGKSFAAFNEDAGNRADGRQCGLLSILAAGDFHGDAADQNQDRADDQPSERKVNMYPVIDPRSGVDVHAVGVAPQHISGSNADEQGS